MAAVGQGSFESVLRENLALVLSDELDDQAINGAGGATPGPISTAFSRPSLIQLTRRPWPTSTPSPVRTPAGSTGYGRTKSVTSVSSADRKPTNTHLALSRPPPTTRAIGLSFDGLYAHDLQGRATAFSKLIGGGLPVQDALVTSGLIGATGE